MQSKFQKPPMANDYRREQSAAIIQRTEQLDQRVQKSKVRFSKEFAYDSVGELIQETSAIIKLYEAQHSDLKNGIQANNKGVTYSDGHESASYFQRAVDFQTQLLKELENSKKQIQTAQDWIIYLEIAYQKKLLKR